MRDKEQRQDPCKKGVSLPEMLLEGVAGGCDRLLPGTGQTVSYVNDNGFR